MTVQHDLSVEQRDTKTAGWNEVRDLLASGEYIQAANFLHRTKREADRADYTTLTVVLEAAYLLCLACKERRAGAEQHRQLLEDLRRQERELRQYVDALLTLLVGGEASVEIEATAAPHSIESQNPPDSEQAGIWQRIRSLFGDKDKSSSSEVASLSPLPVSSEEAQELIQTMAREEERMPALSMSEPSERTHSTVDSPQLTQHQSQPSLIIHCLGRFRVYNGGESVDDWPSHKGESVFKYLVAHRERPVAKEVLMDVFWPEFDADAARNNLNVAIYGLRQALRGLNPELSYVLFQNDSYVLNPDIEVWVDVEEFESRVEAAQRLDARGETPAATREYQAAEALYQGDFLADDRYDDWVLRRRQSLKETYLTVLEWLGRYYLERSDYDMCVTVSKKLFAVEPCREETHRRLMRCYSRQGQRYLALRQYHRCEEALAEELDADPSQTTVELYERIRKGERL